MITKTFLVPGFFYFYSTFLKRVETEIIAIMAAFYTPLNMHTPYKQIRIFISLNLKNKDGAIIYWICISKCMENSQH